MWGTIIVVLILALITAVILAWVALSHDPFTNTQLIPGEVYRVGERPYLFPKDITIEGKCLLLKPIVIEHLRTLMQRVHEVFNHCNIPYHASGGTLLGVERHQTIPLPYDDDIDLAVDFIHRDYLFSKEFQKEAEEYGLITRFLAGTSLKHADRHGAALRLQLSDTNGTTETCDVFFLKTIDGFVHKIDGWNDTILTLNTKETFPEQCVYPRQLSVVDGLEIWLPQNPRALLKQQYGEDCFTIAKIRPRLISHAFPMQFLRLLWVKSI